MEMQIVNMVVKRVLTDTSSSINILYISSLERMGLSCKDLKPWNKNIYTFLGECMTLTGMTKLLVTAGTVPLRKNMLKSFIVVYCLSAYNVVMGRPFLIDL